MRIAHSADNHIGCRLYSSVLLQEDFKIAAETTVDLAIQHNADALLLAGDVLHTSRTSAAQPMALRSLHEKAKAAGLPVLAIDGNHDGGEVSWSSVIESRKLSDGETVTEGGLFNVSGITVIVRDKAGKEVKVHGCSIAGREELKEYKFTPCDIFLYHGPVLEFFSFGEKDTIPRIEDFPWHSISKIAALGDIHKKGLKVGPDNKLIGYPGSTNSTQKSEDPNKSFYLYDLDKGTTETIPVVIPRTTIKFAVSSEAELEALRGMVEEGKKYLIHLTYPGEQYHLLQRIRQLFDLNKVFIDPNPLYKSTSAMAAARAAVDGEVEEDEEAALQRASQLTLDDIINMMTGGSGGLHDLVSGLASPDSDSVTHIDAWVAKRMAELGLEATVESNTTEEPVPATPVAV